MTQQQKKFILANQLLDSSMVNETYRTYPSFVAKIQVYMSNETQNSNYFFHYFENQGRKKICLTLWQ